MPVMKSPPVETVPSVLSGASVVPLRRPARPPFAQRIVTIARAVAGRVVPPLVVIVLGLLVWELVCRKAGATLPPPSAVLRDTWELIVDPFYDHGGIDKGLFW